MKQNMKVFLLALVMGMIVSYLVCVKFDNPLTILALDSKVTYFYVGAYNTLEEATNKKANYENVYIWNDNGVYKLVLGLYNKKESVDLMASYFTDKRVNFRVGEVNVAAEFIKKINDYEMLIKSSSSTYYDSLNAAILKEFGEYKS